MRSILATLGCRRRSGLCWARRGPPENTKWKCNGLKKGALVLALDLASTCTWRAPSTEGNSCSNSVAANGRHAVKVNDVD